MQRGQSTKKVSQQHFSRSRLKGRHKAPNRKHTLAKPPEPQVVGHIASTAFDAATTSLEFVAGNTKPLALLLSRFR